jgi:hypothetical protein
MTIAHLVVEGLGLESIEMEEVAEALNLIISLQSSPTLSAPLLTESLELLQLEVGLEYPVLEKEFQ